MFFKKKPKRVPQRNANAAAVNRILVCALLVGYFFHAVQYHTISPIANGKEIKDSIVKAVPELPEGFYKNFFPSTPAAITIQDTTPGSGEPAVCGQDATIAYTVTQDKKLLPDNAPKEKPLTFRIGDHKVMLALEEGVVGMGKNGKRLITSPPRMAYDQRGFTREDMPKGANVVFHVELLDAAPAIHENKDDPLRIADLQHGRGSPVLCNSSVKAHVTIWDKTGKKLFATRDNDNKPLIFTTGKSEVFMGLDEGVIGMKTGGKRTLSVPPEFQNTLRGTKPTIEILFPPKQTVLVDVETIP